MSTFLKYMSIAAMVTGMQLVISSNALAATQSQLPSPVDASTPSKAELQLKNSTYTPPDDIGGPDRTQGSGTR
ncbi:hypothetical protein H6G89_13760 [Oscillatoria sp. FACHB-1407]|uniref:hypothetical protein n=1 Tax=Oscillatoria sp. FACHB-1407 TaxID=2692847 RepID=UPI001688B23E|nr:hypothetical protein [Oscillatoria sp. FACHB-1407]MBD2462114.1 hypothetical protein [Oscillatoria sp. FACHB-1407]